MATYEYLKCQNCRHYEQFHQMPNPTVVKTHWCTKCNDAISYYKAREGTYLVYLPKQCYFNNYFEESDEYKEQLAQRYSVPESGLHCQVED